MLNYCIYEFKMYENMVKNSKYENFNINYYILISTSYTFLRILLRAFFRQF